MQEKQEEEEIEEPGENFGGDVKVEVKGFWGIKVLFFALDVIVSAAISALEATTQTVVFLWTIFTSSIVRILGLAVLVFAVVITLLLSTYIAVVLTQGIDLGFVFIEGFIEIRAAVADVFLFIPTIINLVIEVVVEFFRSLLSEWCPGFVWDQCFGIPVFKQFVEFTIALTQQYIGTISTFFKLIVIGIQDWICQSQILQSGSDAFYCLYGGSGSPIRRFISDPLYFYINEGGIIGVIQAIAGVVADILDVFSAYLLPFIFEIYKFLAFVWISTIQHVLLAVASFMFLFVNWVFSLLFLTRTARPSEDSDAYWDPATGSRQNYTDFTNLAMFRMINTALYELDPLSLLYDFNETDFDFPQLVEFRKVLTDIAVIYEEALDWIFVNLPYILVWLDKTICTIGHLDTCMADYGLCELLFDPSNGWLTALLQNMTWFGYAIGIAVNILKVSFIPLMSIVSLICDIVGWIVIVISFGTATLPFSCSEILLDPFLPIDPNLFGNAEQLLEICNIGLEFISLDQPCVCSTCILDEASSNELLLDIQNSLMNFSALFQNVIMTGVPCDPIAENRCCVINSPTYKSYDQFCKTSTGSTYTSILFWLFGASFEPLANDPPPPTRCTLWGSDVEILKRFHNTYNNFQASETYEFNVEFKLWRSNASFPLSHDVFAHERFGGGFGVFGQGFLGFSVGYSNGWESKQRQICTDIGWGIPEWFQNLIMGYGGLYTDGVMYPFMSCQNFIWLNTQCYQRYKISQTDDGWPYGVIQKLKCPDGERMLQLVEDINPAIDHYTFRESMTCYPLSSHIAEYRNVYLKTELIRMLKITYGTDKWTNGVPDWYKMDARTIVDHVKTNDTDSLCEIYELQADGGESVTECKTVFSTLVGNLAFQVPVGPGIPFPGVISDICNFVDVAVGDPLLFVNSYHNYRDIGNSYSYNNIVQLVRRMLYWTTTSSDIYYTINFCNDLLSSGPLYASLLFGDPEPRPIINAVNYFANYMGDEDYPWSPDSPQIDCSDNFNYDHLLTQHFIVASHLLFNRRLSGEMILSWWEDIFKLNITVNETNECSIHPSLDNETDCGNTNFYVRSVRDELLISTSFQEREYSEYFTEIFFREVKHYVDFGDLFGGDNTFFEYIRTYWFDPVEYDWDKFYIATGLLIDKIKNFMDDGSYWASVQAQYIPTTIDYAAIKNECKISLNNEYVCAAYVNSIENNSAVKDCMFDPYNNDASDCVKVFFEQNYGFKNGLNVYNKINNFKWED